MENLKTIEILIVEDNPQDAELMMRELKKNGIVNAIHVVEDGEEAIDFLFSRGRYENLPRSKNLKVIFLDIKLPRLNGIEVLQIIKNNSETKKYPVVIVTSSRQDPDIRAAYELGANSYIVKPIGFENFSKAIQNLGLYWLLLNEPPQ